MFKFIHTADIHLDSPLRGLARYEGAPVDRIRGATREALKGLVQTAIDENVAFIVITGDLFDGDWRDYNTGLFFAGQMSRLRENNIQVFVLAGNHDAASRITKNLKMPDNVRQFSTRRPETIILDEIGVALHGQGFSRPDITLNLVAGYPMAIQGSYNIGALHTAVTGREGHELYAPCKIDDMTSRGYDYWALGHIHKREILLESPWIIFPGNIQGRHIRETGPKGCTLVRVADDGSTEIEHRTLDVIRWARIEVDATGARSPDDVVVAARSALEDELSAAGSRMLATRVEIAGACKAHEAFNAEGERWINQLRADATDISGGEIWVEKVSVHTTLPINIEKLSESDSPVGHLLASMRRIASDPQQLSNLSEGLSHLKSRLPIELRQGEDAIDLESPEQLKGILEDAMQILLPHLLAKSRDA